MAALEPALIAEEQEILGSLDEDFRPFALRHRAMVLARGIPFRFISGYRSRSHQEELYEDYQRAVRGWEAGGKKGPGPRPVAKPGHSKHHLGFAYDATGPRTDAEWQAFGQDAEALNLEWGGRYRSPDRPHVEMRDDFDLLRHVKRIRLLVMAVGILGMAIAFAED